jgi:hypothetical protein
VPAGTRPYAQLRWGSGRAVTRSVLLGSDAGTFITPYPNTCTTLPTEGQAIPCQLSGVPIDDPGDAESDMMQVEE